MNRLIKILIVDDEQIMREGLRLTIDWEKYGLSVIGVASNGEKALRLCETETPDLVITDIRMPVMDGLELTKELVARYPRIKIIILSAYDDFKYAQKAITYGASEYLLKSELECEHLLTLVLKITQNIFSEQKSQIESLQLKNQFLEHLNELQNNLCWNLLISPQYPQEIVKKISHLSMDLREDDLIIIHVHIHESNTPISLDRSYYNDHIIKSGYWLTSSSTHYIFIGNMTSHDITASILSREIQSFNTKLQTNLSSYCSIFYSPVFSGFENVYKNNQTIIKYSQTYLFYERFGIYCCGNQSYHTDSLQITPILTKYIQLIESNQLSSAANLVHEICASFPNHLYFPDDIKEFLTLICSILEEKAQNIDEIYGYSFQKICRTFTQSDSTKQTFYQYKHLSTLLKEFGEYEQSLLQFIEKNSYPYHSNVKKAIQYIHKHLSEEITLQLIAKEIYCNPTYLSQVFKKEVHMNFSDFLLQTRLKRAMSLLTTTSLSIGEIAEQVGIPNQSYFSRSFIQFTGMQPSKYRQNYSTVHLKEII